ncbi:MAG: RidA family protein [Betaproteobacteria bacterium]
MNPPGPPIVDGLGKPLARYAATRRFGDFLFLSGVVAVDPRDGEVIERYDQLSQAAKASLQNLGYCTGQASVDVFEAPIVAQSWIVLERIRELVELEGARLEDVSRLVQYFTRLSDYPAYNRVRQIFFPAPVVSTVVGVAALLPDPRVRVEVEATVWMAASLR